MAARGRNRINQFGTQFLRQLRQIGFRQLAQIQRNFNAIKQWCFKILGQSAGSNSKLNSCRSLKENQPTSKKRSLPLHGSVFRQRYEFFLVARNDIETARAPFFFCLLDPLLG